MSLFSWAWHFASPSLLYYLPYSAFSTHILQLFGLPWKMPKLELRGGSATVIRNGLQHQTVDIWKFHLEVVTCIPCHLCYPCSFSSASVMLRPWRRNTDELALCRSYACSSHASSYLIQSNALNPRRRVQA
jgi:hypothetical protein